MKLVTVIVPVYNVEKFLNKCVDSICRQTYTNLEIIIVDDGSTDNSGCICDELKEKDERIIVIHKMNGGLSDARNAGLEVATGDYIGFVDSDDYIESDMYELLVNNIEEYKADVSCCRYAKVYEDGKREPVGDDHSVTVFEGLNGLKEYLYGKTLDPFVCNKLYQAYSIHNKLDRAYYIRFVKGILGEDNPFNADILKNTDKVVIAGEAKYNYLQGRKGAITSRRLSQKKIDSVYWWDEIRTYCHDHCPSLEKYALRRQILFYIGLYNDVYDDKNHLDVKREVQQFISIHNKDVIHSEICENTVKIATVLLAKVPRVYIIFMKLYKIMVGTAKI